MRLAGEEDLARREVFRFRNSVFRVSGMFPDPEGPLSANPPGQTYKL